MEYLPGRELTVDCFSDRERGVLFARARPRERTRAGISMATRTEPDRVSAASTRERSRRGSSCTARGSSSCARTATASRAC